MHAPPLLGLDAWDKKCHGWKTEKWLKIGMGTDPNSSQSPERGFGQFELQTRGLANPPPQAFWPKKIAQLETGASG